MTVVELPASLRSELKEPLGPIYTDATELLTAAGSPLIAVGDVVTYHLIEAGETPAVAVVDERTEREEVRSEIADRLASFEGFDNRVSCSNPPATLSEPLLSALREAIERSERTLIDVDGEEDLATLPALLLAPADASIVYGQPDEGMVHVEVSGDHRERAREILSRMNGDTARLWSVLGVDE